LPPRSCPKRSGTDTFLLPRLCASLLESRSCKMESISCVERGFLTDKWGEYGLEIIEKGKKASTQGGSQHIHPWELFTILCWHVDIHPVRSRQVKRFSGIHQRSLMGSVLNARPRGFELTARKLSQSLAPLGEKKKSSNVSAHPDSDKMPLATQGMRASLL